jgi:hypothetical protein
VAKLAFHEEAEAKTNPPEGAMAKSLTSDDVDVIHQAVSFLKENATNGSDNQPAAEGSDSNEEVLDLMGSITKEDLVAAIGEGVGQGVALALAKSEEERLAREAEAAKTTEPAVEAEMVKAEVTEAEGEQTVTAELQQGPDMAEMIKSVMTEAISPLSERLAALEGQPAAGGPLVGAGGAGGFTPGVRGVGSSDVPPEITDLRARIQKAEADGDTITTTRLRKELGQRVLEVAWHSQGYPQTGASARSVQYTDNAAGR